jgi:hypothetical protein
MTKARVFSNGMEITDFSCKPAITPGECCSTCDNSGRDIEMVDLDDLVDIIAPETAYKVGDDYLTAPNEAIRLRLSEILTELTKSSGILLRRETICVQKGVREYYISPVVGERIDVIHSVCVDGRCLDVRNNKFCSNGRVGRCGMPGNGFVFEPMDKIVLDQAICNECKNITVIYSAFVANDACSVDRVIVERYRRALITGTAAKLRKMGGVPWSIPALGQDLMREYEGLRTQASIDAGTGFVDLPNRINVF